MTTITKRLRLYGLGLLVLLISYPGLADKGELLFESTMKTPESVKGWNMEGPGIVDFRNGWMHMFSPEEKMHHVYWCPRTFPSRFIAEWETQNIETDAGLCIVFFAAKGEKVAVAVSEDQVSDQVLAFSHKVSVIAVNAVPFQHGELRQMSITAFIFTKAATYLENFLTAGFSQQSFHADFR